MKIKGQTEYFTTGEVAAMFSVRLQTVRNWIGKTGGCWSGLTRDDVITLAAKRGHRFKWMSDDELWLGTADAARFLGVCRQKLAHLVSGKKVSGQVVVKLIPTMFGKHARHSRKQLTDFVLQHPEIAPKALVKVEETL